MKMNRRGVSERGRKRRAPGTGTPVVDADERSPGTQVDHHRHNIHEEHSHIRERTRGRGERRAKR